MKQVHYKIVVLLAILCGSTLSNAQVQLGAKVGINSSMPKGSDFLASNTFTSSLAYDAGLVAHFPLGNGGLFISTGIGLSKSGFSSVSSQAYLAENTGWYFDVNENNYYDVGEPEAGWSDVFYHRDYELSTFNMPVGLMYKFLGKKINLYFEAGAEFSYLTQGNLSIDLLDGQGSDSSPSALFYVEDIYTFEYLTFYKDVDASLLRDFGGHEKGNLYYADELTFGTGGDNYFSNLLISGNVGLGMCIDLFHGDIYLGANYIHGLNTISNDNAVDVSRPNSMNRVVASLKYTIDLVL